MLNISKQALGQLKELRERQGAGSMVRIGIMSGSTSGPTLGITMDAPGEKDEIFTFDDLEVIMDKGLINYCQSVSVEYVLTSGGGCGSGGGFKIIPQNPL